MEMLKKNCTKCGLEKLLFEFWKDKRTHDGLQCWCKDCRRENNRKNKPTPEESRKRFDRTIDRHIVAVAKQRAKKRGVFFSLKPGDILVPEKCPLLGIPLKRGRGRCSDGSPTLDRIDPNKGYTKDNVWVISYRANLIKSDATPEEIVMIGETLKRFVATTYQDNLSVKDTRTNSMKQIAPYAHLASLLGAPADASLHLLITYVHEILAKNQRLEADLTRTQEKLRKTITILNETFSEITVLPTQAHQQTGDVAKLGA